MGFDSVERGAEKGSMQALGPQSLSPSPSRHQLFEDAPPAVSEDSLVQELLQYVMKLLPTCTWVAWRHDSRITSC